MAQLPMLVGEINPAVFSDPPTALAPRPGVVLVVEDHDDVRVGMAELLELHGFRVADVADAEHAIDYLTASPFGFALVLLDLLLPGAVSGASFREWQLSDPDLAAIPMVVVSAFEPDARLLDTLRPATWLEKPFRCDHLLDVVRRYVKPEPHAIFRT